MVEDVFRIILGVAAENKINRIDNVNLVIGEYLQVKPDIFKFAFEAAKEGTIASSAKLNLEVQPVELKCETCDNVFFLNGRKYYSYLC